MLAIFVTVFWVAGSSWLDVDFLIVVRSIVFGNQDYDNGCDIFTRGSLKSKWTRGGKETGKDMAMGNQEKERRDPGLFGFYFGWSSVIWRRVALNQVNLALVEVKTTLNILLQITWRVKVCYVINIK